jgi:succinyl-CoA synthetase alpha subunit
MSILVDKNTKVICQGITGKTGTFHTEQALAYGTKMVGGVTPRQGRHWTGTSACRSSTPSPSARSDRRRRLRDLRAAARRGRRDPRGDRRRDPADRLHHRGHPGDGHGEGEAARSTGSKSRLIGPNCPGVLTPNECKIGIMPGNIFKKGSVGIVSRSGTLTYEAVFQTTNEGPRPDDGVGIGGDPVKGTEFIDVLEMFLADDETKSIIMIGEIGGSAEEDAAQFLIDEEARPQEADGGFIAGRTAPPGRAWAMPARSSPAARAAPKTRSRRWKPRASPPQRRDAFRADSGDARFVRAIMMIRAYRMRGHLHANLDPLGIAKPLATTTSSIRASYGFTEADSTADLHRQRARPRIRDDAPDARRSCERTYCSTLGVEFMHISDPSRRAGSRSASKGRTRKSPSRPTARRRSSTS